VNQNEKEGGNSGWLAGENRMNRTKQDNNFEIHHSIQLLVQVFFALMLSLGMTIPAWAQTTIWSEDFEGLSIGAQQGSGTPLQVYAQQKKGRRLW